MRTKSEQDFPLPATNREARAHRSSQGSVEQSLTSPQFGASRR